MTRVLLVEDSADVLYLLKLELEWMGYEVEAATDAKAGLAAVHRRFPDLIVSDLGLPGIDGFEFIRQIREIPEMAWVPAIALSGANLDRDINHALAVGFTAHLAKPVEAKELGRRIELLTTRCLQRQVG
jgi:CheY-like chemotaxis protein